MKLSPESALHGVSVVVLMSGMAGGIAVGGAVSHSVASAESRPQSTEPDYLAAGPTPAPLESVPLESAASISPPSNNNVLSITIGGAVLGGIVMGSLAGVALKTVADPDNGRRRQS